MGILAPGYINKGIRSKDCQVATIVDNHTQTMSSVSSQVRSFEWNVSSREEHINADGRFVTTDDAEKSVYDDAELLST